MQTARMLAKASAPNLPFGTGTKIRFRQTADSWIADSIPSWKYAFSVYEFKVFESTYVTGTRLPLENAFASSSNNTLTPEKAIDYTGGTSTSWASDHTQVSEYQSWWCDLGGEATIRSVSIVVFASMGKVYLPKTLAIDLWDGVSWVEFTTVNTANTADKTTQKFENLQ